MQGSLPHAHVRDDSDVGCPSDTGSVFLGVPNAGLNARCQVLCRDERRLGAKYLAWYRVREGRKMEAANKDYLYQGISARQFKRTFKSRRLRQSRRRDIREWSTADQAREGNSRGHET